MRPLKASEVDVRIGTVGKRGVTLLLYKDARVDRQILDEEFGQMNWVCKYSDHKGNLFCAIGVYDSEKGDWVWKEDCGTESNTEKEKGEASDAFKRAGFRWGIGIELYTSPFIFLPMTTEENGRGYKLKNPSDAYGLFVADMTVSEIDGAKKITSLSIGQEANRQRYIIWSTDKSKEGSRI